MSHFRVSVAIGTVATLLVISGSASATTLTSPTGTVATPTIKAESEGHATITNPIANIQCDWRLEGSVSYHSGGNVAMLPLSSVTPSSCTNSWHVTAGAAGALTIEWTNGYKGTVRSTGMTVDTTRLGITCTYLTNNTKIGTITGGGPATLHLEGGMPIHAGSSGLCGSEPGALTGTYKVTNPASLFIDSDGTSLTSPTGAAGTPQIKAASENHVASTGGGIKIECTWNIEGAAEGASPGKPVVVVVTSVAITNCTGVGSHATFKAYGVLEIEWTSGYTGTVIWTGATMEWTGKGFNCNYYTSQTPLGTITGGNPATIDMAMELAVHSGSVFCLNGSGDTPVAGSFKINTPSSLFVDPL